MNGDDSTLHRDGDSPWRLQAEVPGRRVYWLSGTGCDEYGIANPAVWLLDDRELGGVLVNAPACSAALLEATRVIAAPKYLFLPSHRGARELSAWRAAGVEVLAFDAEAPLIRAAHGSDAVDIAFDRKQRLSRTIDFLPMAGVTAGSCALRCKNLPGMVFFGPALTPGEDGWPTVVPGAEDLSAESRLFGALGIQDLRFEWAFCDRFDPQSTRIGPGAGPGVQAAIERFIAS